MNYQDFLALKLKKNQVSGFEIQEDYLNKNLFDFQKSEIFYKFVSLKVRHSNECFNIGKKSKALTGEAAHAKLVRA